MNITGIRPYEAVGSYTNKIGNAEIAVKNVAIEPGEYLEDRPQERSYSEDHGSFLSERPVLQKETAFDFAQKYDPAARYDLKGSESDLASLDYVNEIPKAHKDEVLKQYQMFVGRKSGEQVQAETQNRARDLENFIL